MKFHGIWKFLNFLGFVGSFPYEIYAFSFTLLDFFLFFPSINPFIVHPKIDKISDNFEIVSLIIPKYLFIAKKKPQKI
jgi:hypothetical protein